MIPYDDEILSPLTTAKGAQWRRRPAVYFEFARLLELLFRLYIDTFATYQASFLIYFLLKRDYLGEVHFFLSP